MTPQEQEIFVSTEESLLYSSCLELLVFETFPTDTTVLELGTGDGWPIIRALANQRFRGKVHGYEISTIAFDKATELVRQAQFEDRYVLHFGSFFDLERPPAQIVISSTPYIPSPDPDILLPELWGGPDGDTIGRQILQLGYGHAFLHLPSYTKPKDFIRYAQTLGYGVRNFIVSYMPFGVYSSEPKVMRRIQEMAAEQNAYITENGYLVACVVFSKNLRKDLAKELIKALA